MARTIPMKYSQKRYCRNCYYPLAYKAKFCSHCGQKDTDGRVRMHELLQQVWFKAFHLESKFLRILWHLFVPGKVSQAYFQGKQKRYPPPVQFFFVIMFFFLYLFSTIFSPDTLLVGNPEQPVMIKDGNWGDRPPQPLSRVLTGLYEQQKTLAHDRDLYARFDSLPPRLRTPEARAAVDSLFGKSVGPEDREQDSIKMVFLVSSQEVKIAGRDFYTLDPETLLDRYAIEGWFQRTLVRQAQKIVIHPDAMINAYIGNLAWTVIALVAVMALVLGLFYWRQHRYYVEHFIFLLHQHSSLFWVLAVAILLFKLDAINASGWKLLAAWVAVSPFFAMLRYYGQPPGKTLVKWLLFSLLYGIGFILFFALGMFVVFLIF